MLVLILSGASLFAQIKVSGTVTEASSGEPMIGVSVVIEGTSKGIITDLDGRYVLADVPSNSIIRFSSIGFKDVKEKIAGRSTVDVMMQPDLEQLDELVVVGYGVQKKRDVTGSISSVKGEALATLAAPSVDAMLSGKASGVQITTQSGIIGSAPRFRIRGISSVTSGTYPLVVVDGSPVFTGSMGGVASNNALGDINPSDIESIEILKDGSGTAIYGSRAANGVVLITTKKGKAGRSKVSYSGYLGVGSSVNTFDLLNAEQFVEIANEKLANIGFEAKAFGTDYDTDWVGAVLNENAFQQNHSLSVSGGTAATKFYGSLGYTAQEGGTKPNEMERLTARASVDHKLNDRIKIGMTLGITGTQYVGLNSSSGSLSGNIFNAIRQLPNTPIYDEDDPTGYNIDDINPSVVGRWDNLYSIGDNVTNIIYIIDNNKLETEIKRTMANAYAQVDIIDGLNYRLQASMDNSSSYGFRYYNPIHGDGAGVNGSLYNTSSTNTRWNLQNIISFNKSFDEAHNVSAVLINEFESTTNKSFSGYGTDLANEFFSDNLISGSFSSHETGGSKSENGFISYAGRLNYNYKEKYYIQGSLRNDGLSSLPGVNKYGLFPGGSVGWTVSKESFFSPLTDVVSDLKIRGSYAVVGNSSIGNYPYQGLYSTAPYGSSNGIAFDQAGNQELRWETSKKYDVGFDASFKEGKYQLTFDYYFNNSDGLVMDSPVPASMGIPDNSITSNVGEVNNWGYELSGKAELYSDSNWKIGVDANLTLSKNEVVKLTDGADLVYTYYIIREGESMRTLYGYDYEGVNMANGNPVYKKVDGTSVQLDIDSGGEYVYDSSNPSDLSVDSSLDSSDKIKFGPSLPTFYGAFNISTSFKNFDLLIDNKFQGGNYIYNENRDDLLNQSFTNNGVEILGRWQSVDNPGDGWTPKLAYNQDGITNLTASSRFLEKGDYWKISKITLGYSFSSELLDPVGFSKARIYAQIQDPFVFTKYTGIDPEMESNGVDYNGTPRQQVMTFGLSVTF